MADHAHLLHFVSPPLRDKLRACLTPGYFFRNAACLLTGTVVAQAIGILVSPILTRLYSEFTETMIRNVAGKSAEVAALSP